jgi:hypothetical protein
MTLSTTSPGDEREAWNALTDEDRDRAFNRLDGGLEGFMKLWGWLHYAKAIEAICREKNAARSTVQQVGAEWMPIETAPVGREMFVARAVNVVHPFAGPHPYTSDPWCVWQDEPGKFARWPHRFPPTHWLALPSSPKSEQGDQQ